jgi:hypothetical protein
LIVTSLGTFLYSYTLTATGLQQSYLESEVEREADRAMERFRVVAVLWQGDDRLNVTILNYGLIDIQIIDIYVNGVRVSTYYGGRGEEVYTSELGWVCFESPIPIETDSTYEITLVSERGVAYVYLWES